MKKQLLIGSLILFLISCEENENEKILLNGTWIESSQQVDTLVFNKQSSEGFFILNRMREIRNGYLLPIAYAGPYDYIINGDSINLRYGFSSNFENYNYYFSLDIDNEILEIGNFFEDSLSKNVILTFSKQ